MPCDKSKSEFDECYRSLYWPTIPFGDARIKQLQNIYGVTGVPQLVILDVKTGFLVTKNGRKDVAVSKHPDVGFMSVFKNWHKLLDLGLAKGDKKALDESQADSQRKMREEFERRR